MTEIASAGKIQHGQRFQDVVELAAREINGDVLAAPDAPKMLEVADPVLVENHAPDG